MKQCLLILMLLGAMDSFAQTLEDDRVALIALYNATNGTQWTDRSGWTSPGTIGESPCAWFGVKCNTSEDRVVELNLPHNHLIGSLPAEIGRLSALMRLDLDQVTNAVDGVRDEDGVLSGLLPTELGNLINLEYLDLGGNSFSGNIPASVGNLHKLGLLDLSYTPFDVGFDRFGKLGGPIPDLSSLPTTAKVYINNQSFTFEGMDVNISRLVSYSPQNFVKLNQGKKIEYGQPGYDPEDYFKYLWVNVGGTESLNEYKLFKDNVLEWTQTGEKLFYSNTGLYRIEVTNPTVPGLTLVSNEEFFFDGAIPVRLINFDAKNSIRQNHLTWTTTSETNNLGFEIEKSQDAKSFERIGFLDGNGDSKEKNIYNFTDPNPFSISYYRLKQIDFDGKYEYSRIITLKDESSLPSIYPNPAQNQLLVTNVERPEKVLIRNARGEVLLNETLNLTKSIDTGSLPSGLYFISIGQQTQKFLIQK